MYIYIYIYICGGVSRFGVIDWPLFVSLHLVGAFSVFGICTVYAIDARHEDSPDLSKCMESSIYILCRPKRQWIATETKEISKI